MPSRHSSLLLSLTSAVLVCACVTQPPAPSAPVSEKPAPAPVHVQPKPESPEQIAEKAARAAAQAELDSGIALYTNGDFRAAIKRFGAIQDSLKPYKDLELQALKYTAFSYCVSGHVPMCKLEFEKAFKLDSTFDLEPGEKGHPLWGPVFERAKKEPH
jgi:hypothetical protein